MNFNVFGKFLIAVAMVALLVAGFFYRAGYLLDKDRQSAISARVLKGHDYLGATEHYTVKATEQKQAQAKNYAFWFSVGGSIVLVLGVGVVMSAKKPEDGEQRVTGASGERE